MSNELTRDQVEGVVREALANPQLADAKDLVEFLLGFSSAHYVCSGVSLQDWLALCRKSYLHSHAEGVARGLIDAPS